MSPWPCSTCGAPGFRNVGSKGYCLGHWSALVSTFSPESIPENGLMLPTGRDEGDGWWECTCRRCGATATTAPPSACPWCVRRARDRDVHQRELLFNPELPDINDQRYGPALDAWARRIAVAAESGLITEAEARQAARRLERRHAAG